MIGVIADDLSGAAEIGAVALRFGLRARVVCGGAGGGEWDLDPSHCRPETEDDSEEVICVDTDSRLGSKAEACRRAGLTTHVLSRAGVKWVYKKIDSVLRGHVVAEVDAILSELGLCRAIVVPANPSRGRIVRRGRYWIGNRPIHETEFARDPDHPRTNAGILELLGGAEDGDVHVARPSGEPPRTGIVVGEAATARDLQHWAKLYQRRVLMAGAAEFFAALVKQRGRRESALPGDVRAGGRRELFVCGTMSKSAAAFLRQSRAKRLPIVSLPSELAWGAEFTAAARNAVARRATNALRRSSRVIIAIGLPLVRDAGLGRCLTQHLVGVAADVIRAGAADRVYAEGGATGAALVSRMGWKQMDVLEEVAPGVATLGVRDGSGICLTIKPGSYVWPASVMHEEAPDVESVK